MPFPDRGMSHDAAGSIYGSDTPRPRQRLAVTDGSGPTLVVDRARNASGLIRVRA
jgi:hypothetical protein